jgi:hypothetical protein
MSAKRFPPPPTEPTPQKTKTAKENGDGASPSPPLDLMGTSTKALHADLVFIRAALLWITHHPQLTPLIYTLGKYAANHTLSSCFSKGTCKNCTRCLHFLGFDIDNVGVTDLCESALMSAYAEAIHHPFYSMELASKGIAIIQHAVSDLASMPEIATSYHNELARYLSSIVSSVNAPTPQMMNETLMKGQTIYNTDKTSAWLYVGLPEVFAKIKSQAVHDTQAIQEIINEVYNKWRGWGQMNAPLIQHPPNSAQYI